MKTEDLKPGLELECTQARSLSHPFNVGQRVRVEAILPSGRVSLENHDTMYGSHVIAEFFEIPKPSLEQRVVILEEMLESINKVVLDLRNREVERITATVAGTVNTQDEEKPVGPIIKILVSKNVLNAMAIFDKLVEPIGLDDFQKAGGHGKTWNYLVEKGLIRHTAQGPDTTKVLFRRTRIGNAIKTTGLYKVHGGQIIQTPKAKAAKVSSNGQSH